MTVPQGALVAFEKGSPMVRAAANDLGGDMIVGLKQGATDEAPPARPQPGGTEKPEKGKTVNLHLHKGAIVINGAKDDREMVARVKEAVISLMDGEALQMGAGETVAA